MDNTKQSPSILSLCTGLLRGLELGIEDALQTNIRTVAYVEIEAFVVDNLMQGMQKGILDPTPVWTNLKTFPYRQFHGKIFGITGGYPCQPFSVAGNRNGDKDPRHLWPYIRRITESTQPFFCFFENVEGHLNLGFEEVSRDLRKMGYRVEAGIYSAEEVGAPHQRKRLFILAIRNGGVDQIKKMGNTDNSGSSREKATYGREEHVKERSGLWDSTLSTGEILADTHSSNAQRVISEQFNKERRPIKGERSTRPQSAFPSRPGEIPFDWEEPRVAKSGMGITIDGYNFREDLLRGAGNGVVWQTASKAFTELLSKF